MRLHSSKARANDKFSMAQAQIYGGQIDAGLQSLDAIILQYRHTPASTQARMLKADYFISKKEFANAESVVRPAIDEGTPKSMMPLALMILGDIQESAGNYTAAIATYTTFIKRYADHFFVPKAYESLGRLYELNGSFTEAKAQYDKLSALYPGGGWAQRAQERIAIISASPLKSAAVQHGNNKQ